MAKKKSERVEHFHLARATLEKRDNTVFVYDGNYLMGALRVPPEFPSMVEVYSPTSWAEKRGEVFLSVMYQSNRAGISSDAKRRQLRMAYVYPEWWTYGDPWELLGDHSLPSEVRGEAVRAMNESRVYVTFPHPNRRGQRISIRGEKLAPIVRKLIDGGIRKIDYEFLLRALKM